MGEPMPDARTPLTPAERQSRRRAKLRKQRMRSRERRDLRAMSPEERRDHKRRQWREQWHRKYRRREQLNGGLTSALKSRGWRRKRGAVLTADSFDDFVPILTQRRNDLGWSQAELDERAGWADGYTGKLEIGPRAATGRRASRDMLEVWITALGLTMAVVVPTSTSKGEGR